MPKNLVGNKAEITADFDLGEAPISPKPVGRQIRLARFRFSDVERSLLV